MAPRHDPDYLRRYVEENWASHNLHWQRSGSVPIGQVFAAETFVPREEFVRSAFYHEWAAPQGHENALGVNVLVEGGSSTVASTMRPFSSGPFSAEEQRIFATLVPHIQRAVQLRHRLAALEMHRASSVAAFDHLRDGVVIVDDTQSRSPPHARTCVMCSTRPASGAKPNSLSSRPPAWRQCARGFDALLTVRPSGARTTRRARTGAR